jgi:hypothetical protein
LTIGDGSLHRVGPALTIVALVWLGLVVGVSFIATPAKFLAPTLELAVALDIGRQTFGVFAIAEITAAITLGVLLFFARRQLAVVLLGALVVLVVAVEQLWLLPLLDERVEIIIQGGVPEASALHGVYIALDGLKILLLTGLAWVSFPRVSH